MLCTRSKLVLQHETFFMRMRFLEFNHFSIRTKKSLSDDYKVACENRTPSNSTKLDTMLPKKPIYNCPKAHVKVDDHPPF